MTEKMDGKSLDITEEKREELKQILPEAFSEGAVDWEKLKAALGEDITFKDERYVLNWAGKSDAFRVLQSPTTATLVPDKETSINFDETGHLFIEGENLEVLKVLQKSYFGKIKMIYIDAFAKDENVINRPNDRLTGRRPIEFIQGTCPVVIVDEPQNMETDIRRQAIENLNYCCTLRYSATHTYQYNLAYRLDPVNAYDLGLVKQIEVDSIVTENDFNEAFVKLEGVSATRTRTAAKVTIDINTNDGVKRKTVTTKVGDDLYKLSKHREIYRQGYIVNGIDVGAEQISLSNGEILFVGDTHGGMTDDVIRFQIEKTIYFVAETKSENKELRLSEIRKIKCGKAHFDEFDDVAYRQVSNVSDLDDPQPSTS